MEKNEIAEKLQADWPDLPAAFKPVLERNWAALADRISAYDADSSIEDTHPLNDFTIPLAHMTFDAGFHNDSQANEFISASMDAAGVPPTLRTTVSATFAMQLGHLSKLPRCGAKELPSIPSIRFCGSLSRPSSKERDAPNAQLMPVQLRLDGRNYHEDGAQALHPPPRSLDARGDLN